MTWKPPYSQVQLPDCQQNFDSLKKVLGVLFPTGSIIAYAGSTAPDSYLLCDGSAVSRTDYGALFTAIGETYGVGDGSTTFNVPDLRGRVPVGVDGAAARLAANDALGDSSGAETHTLTTTEMPAHVHQGGFYGQAYSTNNGLSSGLWGESLQRTRDTELAGGGAAHNNMQPYQVVNYIIKV